MRQAVDDCTYAQVAFVALGANRPGPWGEPTETLQKAIEKLSDFSADTPKVSNIFATPAFPEGSGPEFSNAILSFRTEDDATSLMQKIHEIETEAGRFRRKRWESRVLDLDLIALGQQVLPDRESFLRWRALPLERQIEEAPDELILPHPRMQDRAFVLVPMAEIAPDWRHPVLGKTTAEMRDALPAADRAAIRVADGAESACQS